MNCPYPTYDDVMNECKSISSLAPLLVSYEEIGLSAKGRPIPLLTITDRDFPNENKRVVLVSGGTDGNEEVGRAINLGFARALLEPKNRGHLQKQVVLIVPVTNPDGTVLNLPDREGNGSGICATKVHMPGVPPATPEGRVMRDLVEKWIPDAHFDFHGLAGGGMGDMAYLYPTVNNKWTIPVLFEVAKEIEIVGVKAGFPQNRPQLWWEPRYNLPGWLARNHSSFCMVLESTENYYPIEESVRGGVVRLLRLLEIGEEVRFFQYHANYPCDVVSGSRMGALMPFGDDFTARRKSRRDISQMILEGVPSFGRQSNDYNWTASLKLPITDTVKTFPEGLVFQTTIDGRAKIKNVTWHDSHLNESQWQSWETEAGIVVRATINDKPKLGDNFLKIKYEVPFKRHVEP